MKNLTGSKRQRDRIRTSITTSKHAAVKMRHCAVHTHGEEINRKGRVRKLMNKSELTF